MSPRTPRPQDPRRKNTDYPRGTFRKIAATLAVHPSLVSRVARGQATSARISAALAAAARKHAA